VVRELDFDLGYPRGPARRVVFDNASTSNLLDNGVSKRP
jgi:hypothetical protein